MKHYKSILFLWCIALLFSCQEKKEACANVQDVSKIKVDLKIQRFDQSIFKLKSKNEVDSFVQSNKDFFKRYVPNTKFQQDSALVNAVYAMITNPYLDTVYHDVQKEFGDLKKLKQELTEAFQYTKFYYPDFKEPEVYTIISGLGAFLGTDLYVSDKIWVISLEFFLGKKARYKPDLPQYIWKRYQSEYIVPTLLLALSNRYNETDEKETSTLAEMIYYGKAYQFVKSISPCLPDSVLCGYTAQEIKNLDFPDNKKFIWTHFIENKLLFADAKLQKVYFDERPNTVEMGIDKIPGRIGRWVGWQIIQKYIQKNPDVKLPELMRNKNIQDIFKKSAYKGD
jgi:gliding motility-associated lipoprotein GldB